MPSDTREMRYDVVLKPNSYIHGRVIDNSHKPLERVIVRAEAVEDQDGGETYGGMARTNEGGYFLVYLRPHMKYRLQLINRTDTFPYSGGFDNLEPPIQNLVVQLNASQF